MKRLSRAALFATAALAACYPPLYVAPVVESVTLPAPEEVRAVLILVGDAGDAAREESPLVHHLRDEVERWSGWLGPDSSVVVTFLGDNVYPVGVRDRGDPAFPVDSARLAAQVWAVDGPAARAGGARGIFLPGNHDWGNAAGAAGAARLLNQQKLLADYEAAGTPVGLLPADGRRGPAVVDAGDEYRLVILDTQWWLQRVEQADEAPAMEGVRAALASAGDRPVIIAAHHPYATGGPHSGRALNFDPLWLLRRTGALIQDLNSPPFRTLLEGLHGAFAASGPPMAFVSGHDHSLQVLRPPGEAEPEWSLVSGAGSKLTPVAEAPALEWAGSQPGYMQLFFMADGAVRLVVYGAPPEFLKCDGPDPAECVAAGAEAFHPVYSLRLR